MKLSTSTIVWTGFPNSGTEIFLRMKITLTFSFVIPGKDRSVIEFSQLAREWTNKQKCTMALKKTGNFLLRQTGNFSRDIFSSFRICDAV